jgi:hypothetical protein
VVQPSRLLGQAGRLHHKLFSTSFPSRSLGTSSAELVDYLPPIAYARQKRRTFMDQGQQPANETLHYLLSISNGPPQGPAWDAVLAQVRGASTASLFILSRKAQSSDVRREAAAALNARLHEPGDGGPAKPSSADAVSQDELPPELATHRHFYKFSEGEQWVLATRSGVRVAEFPSEAELDQWWRGLRKQRGRILTKVRRSTP